MAKLGIYDSSDVDWLISFYEEAKKEADAAEIQLEIERQNVLKFRRTLRN